MYIQANLTGILKAQSVHRSSLLCFSFVIAFRSTDVASSIHSSFTHLSILSIFHLPSFISFIHRFIQHHNYHYHDGEVIIEVLQREQGKGKTARATSTRSRHFEDLSCSTNDNNNAVNHQYIYGYYY
jgi:hypothetical protein